MSKNTLSIVMATYNGERFLREQLASLYRQTLQPDEVLVIDDCSTDGTVQILEDYHTTHGLKYVVNEYNLGVNKNFEKGLKLCKGNYIMFCDQDDVWMDNKIELMVQRMDMLVKQNNDIPLIVSSRDTYADAEMNIYHDLALKEDCDSYRDTVIHHLSQGSGMLLNRKCLDYIFPIPDSYTGICYDIHVGYIVAMIGKKYNMKESLMYYRVHGNNVTATTVLPIRHKSSFRRHRETSVVPIHMIKCFKNANKMIGNIIPCDRMDYVKRIIKIAETKNPLFLLWILIITPHVTIKKKFRSFYCSLLNIILLS